MSVGRDVCPVCIKVMGAANATQQGYLDGVLEAFDFYKKIAGIDSIMQDVNDKKNDINITHFI